MELSALGEFGLIDLIDIPNYVPEQVILGIGDDCAVLPFDEKRYQLVSCDLLVEDIHFIRRRISARQLGYKAIAVNLSDVAAMGGKPVHVLLSVALPPDYTVEEWQLFYQGVQEICAKYQVNVIGGDTTSSSEKLTINVTVLGLVEKQHLHLRRAAQPGDVVFGTGPLGGSRAGLELVLDESIAVSQADRQRLWQAHCQPEPCCEEISALNELAGASLHGLNDISDGLLSECREIAQASQVALVLQPENIPVDDACSRLALQLGADGLQWAMTGGEDYQLVGTMAAAQAEAICEQYAQQTGKQLFMIGTVEAGSGLFLERQGMRQAVTNRGYDHFDDHETLPAADASEAVVASCQAYTGTLEQQLTYLQQQQEQQRLYRHDLQNHFACLAGFLEGGKVEEARAYLEQMAQKLPQDTEQTYSQRPILNILLNQKARVAREQQMELQLHCADGLLDFMSDYDLCTLLGNLLDNGLEHSACDQERYLYLDIFSGTAGEVHIRMENSCQQRPAVQHGRLRTQKDDSASHGKGMQQIKAVTEYYGGQFRWLYQEKEQRFLTQCIFSIIS